MAYVYDVLNRVTQIQENGATSGAGLLASYAYDNLGRRSSIARAGGSGAATAYGYDTVSRLSTLGQTLAGSASVSYSFGYNAANQILTRTVTNDNYTAHPGTLAFGYTANGLNQYTSVTGPTATFTPANSATLAYDPTGALQTETTAGATTTLLYDGSALVGEYDSSGNILARYVTGPGVDEPVTWYQGAGTSTRAWYAADNEGSVVAVADQSGNALATYTYGPYGEPITSGGASAWGGSRYRYTGQVEIPAAQLYYYKSRVCDPNTGKFQQTDPVGLNGGINLYLYVSDDPFNNVDSNGWEPTEVQEIVVIGKKESLSDVYTLGDFLSFNAGTDSVGSTLTADTSVGAVIVTAKRRPKTPGFRNIGGGASGGPSNFQCTPAGSNLLANTANVADTISTTASVVAVVAGGAAVFAGEAAIVTSPTGVGLVTFGGIALVASSVSVFAGTVGAVTNAVAGRPVNAAVDAVGTVTGHYLNMASTGLHPAAQFLQNSFGLGFSRAASSVCPS